MKFKATLNNPVGLFKIMQTLEKLGRSCIISFSQDEVRFTTYKEDDSTIPAWVKMKPQSIFSNYVCRSQSNEINVVVGTHDLFIVLKGLQESSGINVQLQYRNDKEVLHFASSSVNPIGTTVDETVETEVIIMPPDRMSLIREPTNIAAPDTYILLPSVSILKPSVDRLKSLGKFINLSANMAGEFKLEIETPVCIGEVSFENLNHPNLRANEELDPERDPTEFSSVRIKSEDLVNFLNCYYVNPSNVVCSISNELQLSFFVYLSIDTHQNEDAPIRTFLPMQSTMTCHIPIYYE